MADHLAETGLLRDDLTVDRARDLIWLYIALRSTACSSSATGPSTTANAGWSMPSTTPSSPTHPRDPTGLSNFVDLTPSSPRES
jgi:hypothetical protein